MKVTGSPAALKVIIVLGLVTLLLLFKNNLAIDVLAVIIGAAVYFVVSYLAKDKKHVASQKDRLNRLDRQLATLKNNQAQQLKPITDQEKQLLTNLKSQQFKYKFPNDQDLTSQSYDLADRDGEVLVIRNVYAGQNLRYQLTYNQKGAIVQYRRYLTPDTYAEASFRRKIPKYEYHSNYDGPLDLKNLPPIETVNTQLQSKDWYYQQLKNKVRHQLAVIKQMPEQKANWFLRKKQDGHWFSDRLANESLMVAEKTSRKYFDLKHENDLSRDNLPGLAKTDDLYRKLNEQLTHLAKLRKTAYRKLEVDVPNSVVDLTEHDLSSLGNKYAGEVAELMVDKKLKEISQGKFIVHDLVLPYPYEDQDDTLASNQIDNLLISNKGIFCIETKARTINSKTYNVSSGYQEISAQIAKHRDAIDYVLKNSSDPVIQKLLKKPIGQYLVHNLVVLVGRSGQDFTLKNTETYTEHGAQVLRLADLQLVISSGVKTDVPVSLTDEEVAALNQVLIKDNQKLPGKGHAGNLVFWDGELNSKAIEASLDNVVELTEQLKIMNDCLDHLIGLKQEIDNLKVQQDTIEEIKQVNEGFAQARNYYEKQRKDHDDSFVDAITV